MTEARKRTWRRALGTLVVLNTFAFFAAAVAHLLGTDPRAAVFVDFWGRFTVYSLWFIGFALYVRFVSPIPVLRAFVILTVLANIAGFLTLANFGLVTNTPDTLVYVDFWGRITVYSLWFLCYEGYRTYLGTDPGQPSR